MISVSEMSSVSDYLVEGGVAAALMVVVWLFLKHLAKVGEEHRVTIEKVSDNFSKTVSASEERFAKSITDVHASFEETAKFIADALKNTSS